MESSEKVNSYYDTVPSWHPLRRFFLVKGSNFWNRLVSVSYDMFHTADYRKLIPRYRVVRDNPWVCQNPDLKISAINAFVFKGSLYFWAILGL